VQLLFTIIIDKLMVRVVVHRMMRRMVMGPVMRLMMPVVCGMMWGRMVRLSKSPTGRQGQSQNQGQNCDNRTCLFHV
jgi:hypothetical protein